MHNRCCPQEKFKSLANVLYDGNRTGGRNIDFTDGSGIVAEEDFFIKAPAVAVDISTGVTTLISGSVSSNIGEGYAGNIGGNSSLNVQGDNVKTTGGNASSTIDGNSYRQIKGNSELIIGGTALTEVQGGLFEFKVNTFMIDGNLSVSGKILGYGAVTVGNTGGGNLVAPGWMDVPWNSVQYAGDTGIFFDPINSNFVVQATGSYAFNGYVTFTLNAPLTYALARVVTSAGNVILSNAVQNTSGQSIINGAIGPLNPGTTINFQYKTNINMVGGLGTPSVIFDQVFSSLMISRLQ